MNCISPGPIDTPIFGKMGLSEDQAQGFKQALPGMVPLGRMGTSDEIAKAALFLACDDSSYITGIDLFVDGGMAQVYTVRFGQRGYKPLRCRIWRTRTRSGRFNCSRNSVTVPTTVSGIIRPCFTRK